MVYVAITVMCGDQVVIQISARMTRAYADDGNLELQSGDLQGYVSANLISSTTTDCLI